MTISPAQKEKLIIDDVQLTDLISRELLQELQDAFADCNKVASTLTDANGTPITSPSNYSKVCTLVRNTEIGRQNCQFSGQALGRQAHDLRRPVRQSCKSIGFSDAAAPIIVGGRHLANWVIGQYHVGTVNEQQVRDYAREIGADPAAMTKAFREMPKISADELDAKLAFLQIMANQLAELAFLRLIEELQNRELLEKQEELLNYQHHLEDLVRERTAELEKSNNDLREEAAAKEKAFQHQQRLFTAIENASETIVVTTTEGDIIYANPSFSKLSGYSREEAIGQNMRLLKSGFHEPQFYQDLWQTISSGVVWKGRFVNKRKDGSLYHEEGTISPILNRAGAVVNFVGVKRDITRELEMDNQLRQNQRLAALASLAAGVAHEINTPIQYILSNTQYVHDALVDLLRLLESGEQLAEAAQETGALIEESARVLDIAKEIDIDYLSQETLMALDQSIAGINQISKVVMAMKDFSLTGSLEKKPTDLNAMLSSLAFLTRSSWQKVAELKLEFEPELPEVPLASSKMNDVLLGMMHNAIDALKEKYGDQESPKGSITLTTKLVDEHVEIRFADTGIGIPHGKQVKIFDPFFTTKPFGQGRGEGLAVARSVIVEGHGGSIKVASEPGAFTEFAIRLPLA